MQNMILETLIETNYLFAVLMALSEAKALSKLEKGISFDDLHKQTHIPEPLLLAMVDLLKSVNLTTSENGLLKIAGDLQEQVKRHSLARVSANLTSAYGQMRELINAASENRLQLGWHHTDEIILQAQGTHSEAVATHFVPAVPPLQALLQQPQAKFLDVGAGVGKICLKLCELYPNLTAVGLEPADIPFSLAQGNLALSPYQNRIELRKIGIEDLDDDSSFDVIWLAQGFILDKHLIPGLPKLKKALKPNGMLFVAVTLSKTLPENKTKHFINTLHGSGRDENDVINRLTDAGFINITETTKSGPYVIITAQS
jgi:2-polyprenyl-3-methyl-5-hydroxy-6-metoxy-1,4-benzoquinol methylase